MILSIVAILILSILIATGLEWLRRRAKQSRFGNREELTVDEIYSRYFAESGVGRGTVARLWRETAAMLHLPPGKLRPGDRFDHELAAVAWSSTEDELSDLEDRMASFMDTKWWGHGRVEACDTLGEYILWVAAHEATPGDG